MISGRDERGFTLTEVVVASVMAAIAVIGLAHAFAMGRGNLNRYQTARSGLALAQGKLETLSSLAIPGHDPGNADLQVGTHTTTVTLGNVTAIESWDISTVDDPANGPGADYTRATVRVIWSTSGMPDTVSVSRILSSP
ncbi:MAG: prepilin-type N-terminal cleavage/methylation domain-containing protein [Candidatus Eisenbacteria bacterium]|uniref:Prepilin-type N-terminal cleavage/methylation domain-containing protein n=1 Tax=Eiseniibacteriota bacterium TaxID=2212470 RepID=A0A9D6L8Q5_UNCEI|nr:prepilin-type N-terminal cleavage/methylation domain-containing protein [Candidatus Eisenbacteria bacterium]MBI3538990.1 prepilin-type N-terminal cleavage/methylation domain-containing protein [Candidatus Eisenbacteria bacterium]